MGRLRSIFRSIMRSASQIRILSGSETATKTETNLIIKAALQGGKGEAPAELHAEPVNHCIGLSCIDISVNLNFN
jgi:hypothetical protein